MSASFAPEANYGLPEHATRQWVEEHSEPDEFGAVPIPASYGDGLFTHATYEPDCDHFREDCNCATDVSVMWTLAEYSG